MGILYNGEGKVSYLQIPIKVLVNATKEYRLVGPIDTMPTPESGYIIDPEPIETTEGEGKFWLEYKIITP